MRCSHNVQAAVVAEVSHSRAMSSVANEVPPRRAWAVAGVAGRWRSRWARSSTSANSLSVVS